MPNRPIPPGSRGGCWETRRQEGSPASSSCRAGGRAHGSVLPCAPRGGQGPSVKQLATSPAAAERMRGGRVDIYSKRRKWLKQ